jgi:hypothetical protein
MLGERWLTPLVPTEVEPGWNELGDKMIVIGTAVEREPFAFYEEDERVGYWILVGDSGTVDETHWQKLVAIARAGGLDDGTPVTSVRLIAPSREEALMLLELATKGGFDMVTYAEEKDVLWRVFAD